MKNRTLLHRIALSSLLCLFTLSAFAADFYKWTDAQGVVHFSETPPKDKNQKAELIRDKHPRAPLPEINTGKQEDEGNDESSGESSGTSEAKKPKPDQVATKDPAICQQAKTALNDLVTKPIIRRDNKVMTIEEKNLEIQRMQEVVDVHCEAASEGEDQQ